MQGFNRRTFLRLTGAGLLGLSLAPWRSSPIQAQQRLSWSKAADLPGGHVTALVVSPTEPDTLYLSSNVNAMGVWKSTDGGESWSRVLYDEMAPAATHSVALAIHPSDPRMVYVTDLHGRIIMTTDGGRSWEMRYEGHVSVNAIAVAPSRPDVLYAGTQGNEVLSSTDGGRSWTKAGTAGFGGIGSLAVDPRDPDLVYAGTRDGIYQSADGRGRWSRVGPANAISLAVDPSAPGTIFAATTRGVFKTADGGESWGLSLSGVDAHSVAVAPSRRDVLYAGTRRGMFRSEDGGDSWSEVNNGLEFLDIGPVAVHPQNAEVAWAGTNIWQWVPFHGHPFPQETRGEGVYKTSDGGGRWEKSDRGFVDVDVNSLALDPTDPQVVVYAGTECSRGIYRSEDGGASWVLGTGGPPGTPLDFAHYTMRIITDREGTVYLTGRFGVMKSTDRGRSWENLGRRRHYHGIAVDPGDPQILFVGTSPSDDPTTRPVYSGAHILKSVDAGRTWQEADDGFPHGTDTSVHTITVDPTDPRVVYVGTSSHLELGARTSTTVGLYKTSDGGERWAKANVGLTSLDILSLAIEPTRPGVLYAGTVRGVYKTSDGARSWFMTGLVGVPVHALAVDPADPQAIYAGTERGLYVSGDGGMRWQRIAEIPAQTVKGISIAPSGERAYAAVNGVGVFTAAG